MSFSELCPLKVNSSSRENHGGEGSLVDSAGERRFTFFEEDKRVRSTNKKGDGVKSTTW